LRRRPLVDRKTALKHLQMTGEEALEAACGLGLEGIVSKRLTAPYKTVPMQKL
jgi:ATP-dependent DNA ligase